MTLRFARWQQDFQRARAEEGRLAEEVVRWQLLSAAGSAERGERSKQGAAIRGKASTLKVEFERLQRELDGLTDKDKATAQFRDDVAKAVEELQDLARRSKGSPGLSIGGTPGSQPPVHSPVAGDIANVSFRDRSLARMADDRSAAGSGGPSGAELQPAREVTVRGMLQRQQQMVADFDEPLSELEGTVSNLQQVSRMIHGEIRLQNSMLDSLNENTDSVAGRLGRARMMLQRFNTIDRNRYLMCSIVLLLVALIVIFVYVVLP